MDDDRETLASHARMVRSFGHEVETAADGIEALERTDGNVSEVAQQLGVGRTTLYRKLREYGLR